MDYLITSQRFSKAERLCSQKLIEALFKEGASFHIRPVKVLFLKISLIPGVPIQLLIAVPKKYIRHATDRNRIKRLFREAYRKNKYLMHTELSAVETSSLIAFVYNGKDIPLYPQVEQIVRQALLKIFNVTDEV